MQTYLQLWVLLIPVLGKQIGDFLASSDWLNIRGWTESIIGWSMDATHDLLPSSMQSEFATIQPALESFFIATIMCTVVFAVMMLTLMVVPYIERKFIARLMDRIGATTSLRSLWIGEGNATAGDWWNKLPMGLGKPIGFVNKKLNAFLGNDHPDTTIYRVNTRVYHGLWFLFLGLFQALPAFMNFSTT